MRGICTFCGQKHHNRRDYQECRARGGAPEPEPKAVAVKSQGDEMTRYRSDPARGNKRAHRILMKHRQGMAPRKIAKHYGLPLTEVLDVIERMSSGRAT